MSTVHHELSHHIASEIAEGAVRFHPTVVAAAHTILEGSRATSVTLGAGGVVVGSVQSPGVPGAIVGWLVGAARRTASKPLLFGFVEIKGHPIAAVLCRPGGDVDLAPIVTATRGDKLEILAKGADWTGDAPEALYVLDAAPCGLVVVGPDPAAVPDPGWRGRMSGKGMV